MRAARLLSSQTGFTLMEMIISLVVLGLLSVVMLPLLSLPMQSYLDAQRRVELQSQMDLLRAKLTDDLRYALPRSLRVRQSVSTYFLEYLEVRATGRYRKGTGGGGPYCPPAPACAAGDALGVVASPATCVQEACLTTLGPLNPSVAGVNPVATDYVAVIAANANPYLTAGTKPMARLTAAPVSVPIASPTPTGVMLQFVGNNFPAYGDSDRLYVVSQPVSYQCNPTTGLLTRHWGYALNPTQPTNLAGTSQALLTNLLSNTALNCRMNVVTVGLRTVVSLHLRLARTSGGQPTEAVESLIELAVREP